MGFLIEGDLINRYEDQTKNGKAFSVYQVSYKAGKQVLTVSVKDFNGLDLPPGPCRIGVFPDVWVGKSGSAVITWIASKDQPIAGMAVSSAGSGGRGPRAVAV